MTIPYHDMTESERQVSEHLNRLGLYWISQCPIFVYDEKNRPRVWTPDFYIPGLGMYVEVAGSEKFDYEYRERIYKKNGVPVIFLHFYKEKERWKNYLVVRIREIEEDRYQEVKKMEVLERL
jgi:hypothetical protein